jgi:hypothetical protein
LPAGDLTIGLWCTGSGVRSRVQSLHNFHRTDN